MTSRSLFAARLQQAGFILSLLALCVLPFAVQARLDKQSRTTAIQRPVAQTQTRILDSGQVKARNGVKRGRTAQGPVTSTPPQFTPQQSERKREPKANPLAAPPGGFAPTVPAADPPTPAPPTDRRLAPTAPNDFVIKDNHEFSIAETSTLRETTHEPSLGSMGGTIFYAANRYAARSTDGGQTFSYVSPFTTFPSVNNGFCCDQVVNYAPAQNMIVWALQYTPDANTGTLRIARAVGNQVAANFWVYYDFTPQDFGLPVGNRMDFPTLTVSANHLYVTSNIHSTAAGDPFTASVVFRIPLAQLAAGGNITHQALTFTDVFSPRCTEGATTTMYWARMTVSNSSLRIYRWADADATAAFDNVGINAFAFLARDGTATSPDGSNWAGNAQTKVLAAWRRNGTLGFMWPAKQSLPARPYPYTIVAQFNESNRAFISQNDIFSPTFAWLYPSVAVNAAGNLGGVIAFGGGSLYPNTALFLVDDVTAGFDAANWVTGALSTAGPFDNSWGDYLTVRPHKTNTSTFVAGLFHLNGSTVVPRYLRFGRERDFTNCTFALAPTSANPGVGGGAASVTVTTSESCNWAATGNAAWLTVTGGATGSGIGTVNYSVAANNAGARTGALTIAGQTFNVTQTGCAYTLNPLKQSFGTAGGTAGIGVTTTAGCIRTAQSNSTWITITSGGSGTGNGTIGYAVAINTGASPRTGSITVADQNFTITQTASNPAVFALAPTARYFTSGGGPGTVGVTANNGAAWTATSNAAWITINSGPSGAGNGTVNYTVAANNTASPRTGIVVIADIPFVVTQGAAAALLEADFNAGIPPGWTTVDGGSGGGAAASTWTAANPGTRLIDAPFASNFAIIDSDQAGDGNTQDEQLLSPVFNAAGFTQVVLEFNSQFLYLANEIADVDVTTNGGAVWTNVLRMQGADDGFPTPTARTVNITGAIALNPANVQIRFRYHSASWAWWWAIDNVRVRCSYTVGPTNHSFAETAATGNVTVTTDAGCPWAATSNDDWLTITAGGNGTGNGAVNFAVAANPGPNTRTGTLTVAGDTVFVRQAAPGVPFETDFNAGLPPDWRVLNGGSGGGPTSTWTPANPCNRPIGGTFAQTFPIMDKGGNCARNTQAGTPNEELMSPPINAADAGQVLLEFGNQFRLDGGNEIGDVEVSTNNGATWTNVLRIQGGHDGFPAPNLKTVDITAALAANPANARIRFRYYGSGQGFAPSGKQRSTGPNAPTGEQFAWWAVDELKVCKYKIIPTSQSFPLTGGANSVAVITGPTCRWSATSAASWITLGATTSGTGLGTLNYTVAANNSGAPRSGSITIAGQSAAGQSIAGQTLTVTQAGCPAITVNPPTLPNGALNASYNQTITATPAGSYVFTLLSGTLPTGLNLSSGGALSGKPSVPGSYNFTVRANGANGCAGTRAYLITIGNPPTVGAMAGARPQGSSAANFTVANVNDADQAANTLAVTVNGAASATVNGVTVSGIGVNAAGLVTANIATTCAAATAAFTLTVTDNAGLTANAILNVTVTPNPAPTLSYNNQSVVPGGALTINPATGLSDNGSLASVFVQNQGAYSGTITVNNTTGVVSVANAQPTGTHTITVRATDNCGAMTDAVFTLVVTPTVPTLGNYPNATVGTGGNTTVTPAAAPTNTLSVTASASTNFKGTLTVNSGTGVVTVVNAHSAGIYAISVTAFSSTGGTTTKSFTLTITNPVNCAPSSPVFSQPAGSPVGVGNAPQSAAVGDFNGDGKHDLAVANSGAGNLTILLGGGNGGFVAAGSPATGTSPQSVAIGDFNGDGKHDLATANSFFDNVTILLGDGTGGFAPAGAPVSAGSTPRSVATGDFNNDGRLDLAVANSGSGNVTILLGNGNGGFTPAAGSPVGAGSGPRSVVVGDFNNDGKHDLAVANATSNNVTILSGNGSGGFTPVAGSPVAAGSAPVSVALSDFNGDGRQDLAVANNGAGNVTILLGNGGGGFGAAAGSPVAVGSNPAAVAVGDFNGDGNQDVVAANGGAGNATVLLGNGSGGFTQAAGSPVGAGSSPSFVALGDFNGDGKQDPAVANNTSNNVTILLNGCAPTISAVAVSRQQGSPVSNSTIANVGDPDQAAFTLTFNINGGASATVNGVTVSGVSVDAAGIVTANVVAACGAATANFTLTVTDSANATALATLTVTVNNPPPTLTYNNQFVAPGGSLTINPATGPSDNGSVASIVKQSQGTYTGTISVNNLTGIVSLSNAMPNGTHTITIRATDNCGAITDATFALTVNFVIPTLGNYPNAAVITGGNTTVTPSAAPINATSVTTTTSTNFKGVLAVNSTTGVVTVTNAHVAGIYPVTVMASNGNGTSTMTFALTVNNPVNCSPANFIFIQPTGSPFGVGTEPDSAAVGDFNGDGKQDLAVANSSSNNVTILLGNGNGGFSPAAGSPVGVGAITYSMAVGDFNGDGKQDLATANNVVNNGSNVTILLGDGSGGFAAAAGSPVGVGTAPRSVAVGDFNGDGKQDLAVANSGSANVTILLGNGSGGFAGSPVSVGSSPYAVAAGDFNGDGKQDLAVANSGSANVTILLGDGSGGFTASPVGVGSNPVSVAVSDFNGDGKQDLAVANSGSNNVTVLLGNGSGGFSPAPGSPVVVGANPRSVAVGDFNGDGQQDLAVANFDDGNVTILLGNGSGGFTGSPVGVGISPRSMAGGDFNGDGQQDLAVGNYSNDNVTILLGNGSGGFSPAAGSPFGVGSGPYSVAVGDFNSDGQQDLAVANNVSANVTILLNNCAPVIAASAPLTRQQGSTGTVSTIATVSDAETAAGSLNVVATTVPAGLTVNSITNTSGTITANVTAACNATVGANTVVMRVTDGAGITSTANLTVNVTANSPPTLTYANQSGAFGNVLTINPATGPSDNGTISTIAVLSVSPSASPGTITVNSTTGVVSVSNNVPVGVYTVTIRATDNCSTTTDAPFTLTVNAIIIPTLGNYSNASVITGGNTTVTPTAAPVNAASITAATLTNFKGTLTVNPTTGVVTVTDAHPALAMAGTYTVTVKAFSSNGGTATKTFTLTVTNPANCAPSISGFSPSLSSPVGVGSQPVSAAIGDFNGDGKQDLAVANQTSNNVTILLGNGSGGFSPAGGSPAGVGNNPVFVAAGDFNGDGKQDLAVANSGSANVTILLGNGSGGFSLAAGAPVGVGTQPAFVAAGDFNGDGKQDLAVANAGSNNVTVLLGDGLAGFSPAPGSPVSVGTQPQFVAVGDFNNNGQQDIAVANSGSNNVTVLLGNGSGGFTASTVGVGTQPASVAVGYFNNDTNQDLAVTNYGSNNVTILLGNGSGGFSAAAGSPVGVGSGPDSAAVGDFNGDGTQDLAVANRNSANVTILSGNGSGGFSPAGGSPVGVESLPYSVVVGDFNGDGKQDLGVTNANSNNVTILLADCAPVITAGAPLTRTMGSVGTVSTIATVSDAETTAGSLSVAATTVPAGLTVISMANAGGTITANVAALGNATAGANTVGLMVTDGSGLTATANLTVNVTANAPTSITTHPSSQTVCAGASASFSVVAGGTAPFTYQWRKNGGNIGGATGSTFTINPTVAADAGSYDVVVTGAVGSATSNAATLTVNAVTSIATQPQNQTVCAGASASFSVTAGGTGPFTYQWRKGGSNIGGATAGSYTIAATVAGDAGSYDVIVTGACGSATSSAATLTVNTAASVTTQPADQTVCAGGNASFTVAANGTPPPTVQWQESTDGGANFNNLAGQTNTTLTLNGVTAGMNNRRYRAVFTNSCNTATTTAAILMVNTAPAVTTPPTDQTACPGANATFTAAASGSPAPTVQWQESTDGGVNFNNLAGQTNTTLTLNSVTVAMNNRRYRAVFTNSCNAAVNSNAAILTVSTSPTISTQPQSQTVCAPASASFTVVATGTGPFTYQWRKNGSDIGGATNSTFTINPTATGDAGNYDVIVTGACGSTTSNAAALTVNSAPAVTTNPNNQTACAGGNASFTVAASGTPTPTVQWQESTDGGANFNNLAGQTNTTLTLNGVTAGMNNRRYRAVFTNSCNTATTTAAILTVNTAPAVTTQPTDQTACPNTNAVFMAAASGSPAPTVQWQESTDGGVNFNNLAGQTNTMLTLNSVTLAMNNRRYRAVFTNSCATTNSNAATLTVSTSPTISTQPQSQTVCAPASASFTVVAGGTGPLTYQWRKNGSDIGGATNSTFTINPTATGDAGNYDVIVTGACGNVTSNAVTLTVNAATSVTAQPQNQAVCAGAPASFSVTAGGTGPFTYQWRKNTVNIGGATGSTFTINPTAANDAGSYDVIVTGACGNVTSSVATLTINAATSVATQPQNQTVCAGASAGFTVTASGTGPFTYQWRKNGANISGATTGSFAIATTAAGDAGNYDVVVTGACGTATSNAATLTVNSAPNITAQPTNQASCVGGSVAFAVTATGTSLSYQWRKGGSDIAGATAGSFTIASVAAGDVGSYDVVITGACGTATSNVATLTLNTTTTINTQPSSQAVCLGAPATFTVAAGGSPPLTYQWRKNGTNIGGATASSYTIAAVTAADAASYDVTVTSGCGTVTSNAAALTINAATGIGVQPQNQTVCAGAAASFSVTAGGTGPFTYQWRKNGNNIGGATSSTFSINPTVAADAGNYDVVVTGSCGATTSNAAALMVNPAPAITTQPAPQTVTVGQSATFSVSVTGTSLSYQWRRNGVNITGATASSFTINSALPVQAGSYDVVVTGACGAVTSNAATLIVNCPTLTFNPLTLPSGTVGATYSQTVTATGGTAPETFAVTGGALPAGLTLSAAGVLSGTPTASGTFNFTVTATDSNGCTGTRAYTLLVCAVIALNPATLPSGLVGLAYNQTLTATGGAAPYSFAVSAGVLPAGLTLSSAGLLAGTPTANGSANFTITATADNGCIGSRSYTLTIGNCPGITLNPATLPAGLVGTAYSQALNPAGGAAPYTFALTVGALPAGLTLSAAGVLTGAPSASGVFNFTATATDNNNCTGARAYTLLICPVITLGPATLANGFVGVAYNRTLTAMGGVAPYTFALSGGALPGGIALAAGGTLSGTPAAVGKFSFTVTATTGNGCTGSQSFTVTIGNCPSITLSPATLPAGLIGTAYNQTLMATGGAAPHGFNVSANALPAGLTLSSSGMLSGAPSAGGAFNFTVTATDGSGCTGLRAYTLVICSVIAITPATLPDGQIGAAYSQQMTQTNGTGAMMWSASTLPANMTLNPTSGLLSGTPTATGAFNFTVRATDANGCFGERSYTVTINPCPTITVNPPSLANGTLGTTFTQTYTQTGGASPITWSLSGALPNGMSFTPATATLSGPPTQSGTFPLTVTATDTNNCVGSRSHSLVINGNGLQFYPLPRPLRLLDTRDKAGLCDNIGVPITGGTSLTTQARITCNGITIPATAQAIVGNVTAINQTAQFGFLTLFPAGQQLPLAANMIYEPNQLLSNNFTVGLNANGEFSTFAERTLHTVIDVSGYFAPPTPSGLFYHALPRPLRLLDTRADQSLCDNVGLPITGGTALTTQARISCNGLTIPTAAQAIVGNATVINQTASFGFMTLFPSGQTLPLAANMIYAPNQLLANAFTVGLSADGRFDTFAERTLHLVIDVAGYYSAEATDANGPGLLFNPLPQPLRLLDTRADQSLCDNVGAPITGGTSLTTQARITCNWITIPNTAQAVNGNVTVINQTAQFGFMTLFPAGQTPPLAANMIYAPGQLLANAFVVGLSGLGEFNTFGERTIHVVIDVSGYFAP